MWDERKRARALTRLAEPGAVLAPLSAQRVGFGVFPDGDRRRKPLARLCEGDVKAGVSEGLLRCVDGARLILTEAGHARVRRQTENAGDFGAQHRLMGDRVVLGGEGPMRDVAEVTVHRANLAESPLIWLARRGGPDGSGFLSPREFAAGETLRECYERSTLQARVTSSWEGLTRVDCGRRQGAGTPSDARLSATDRVLAALRHVGPGLQGVLQAVCCEGRGLEGVERGFGWPQRSGKVVLKIALARLADHYKLPADA